MAEGLIAVSGRTLTVLHLGCGRKKTLEAMGLTLERPGGEPLGLDVHLVNLDLNPTVEPDLLCELGKDRIDLPDDTVDFVFAFHVLEHIGRQGELHGWFHFWQELYRVMRPNGRVQFDCPYSSSVWAWADPTHVRAINEYVFLYLNQDAYTSPGSAIPDYRPQFDFMLETWRVYGDKVNPAVYALEGERSMIGGTLIVRKPLRPYWEA